MPAYRKTAPSDSHVVTEDRFKLLPVTSRVSIRDFVSANGITFAPGRGFYQLTKPETIQAYKEIVAVRISDGAQVSGDAVRDLLEIPSDAVKFKYKQVPDFDVFVQSTSYNRMLMPDTKFLYEVNPESRGSPGKGAKKVVHKEKRNAPAPAHVAGSPIDLVFSFDTTGSMYSCLNEVRKNLETMINRIMTDIPNIRIAVFAQGDYCDHRSSYVTEFLDFSTDKNKLMKFVREVKPSGGGDFEECYELVLQQARTELNWIPGSQRAMVMIGDAIPHSVADYKHIMRNYREVVKEVIDWRKEADELVKIGCRVYAVQCGGGYHDDDCSRFWQGLAFKTYGHHLSLSNFSNVFDFIMAIAYKEQGPEQLEAYKQEVMKRGGGSGLNSDLHALFDSLAGADEKGDDDDDDGAGPSGGAGAVSITSLFAAPTPTKSVSKAKGAAKKPTGAAKKAPAKTAVKRKAPAAMSVTPTKKAKASAAKKPAAKKSPAKKAPTKKTTAKKAPAKKAPAKKAPAKKTPTKKAPTKKAPAKKTPAKKTPAKKTPVKKAPAKKGSARR